MSDRVQKTAAAMFPDEPHKWPGAEVILRALVQTETAALQQQIAELEADLRREAENYYKYSNEAKEGMWQQWRLKSSAARDTADRIAQIRKGMV